MTEEVKEIVPPGTPLPDDGNPDMPVAPTPDESPTKCGYVIGVREDGTFIFDILGTVPGIIELLGLHTIAGERLHARMDKQLGGKYSLILGKLEEIASAPNPLDLPLKDIKHAP
jgi:hypothetical protein